MFEKVTLAADCKERAMLGVRGAFVGPHHCRVGEWRRQGEVLNGGFICIEAG